MRDAKYLGGVSPPRKIVRRSLQLLAAEKLTIEQETAINLKGVPDKRKIALFKMIKAFKR